MRLLRLFEQAGAGRLKAFARGEMLFWQGDPVDYVYVVRSGNVKVFSVSTDGKTYAFGFAGPGDILGASEFLLSKPYDYMAEASENGDAIAIPSGQFERLLTANPELSISVMRKLAQGVDKMVSQVRELGFLDVQQRLKQRLMELAQEHGIATAEGIRIDLDITHEEIGELVAANRATVTAYLNEFKRQGYLWQDGRFLVIVSPEHMEVLDAITRAVVEGDEDAIVEWARKAIERQVDPVKAFEALSSGMRQIDRMLIREEIDVSDVILSAYVMKSGLSVLSEALKSQGAPLGRLGTVVIGTVHGDIHDIGRTMVSMLMTARGFNVIDLGINVSTEDFVNAVKQHHPDILAMSSLMTTTAMEQEKVIEALEREGVKTQVMVLIGGGAITEKFSKDIGANAFAPSAQRAVEMAYRLIRNVQS